MNIILLLGAVLGLSSVMMAAFVDHSVALHLNHASLNSVLTAVRYHQLYAVIISFIGLVKPLQNNLSVKTWLTGTGYVFITGTIFFSVGVYCSAILGVKGIVYLVPVGGMTLMLGWACLIRTALFNVPSGQTGVGLRDHVSDG